MQELWIWIFVGPLCTVKFVYSEKDTKFCEIFTLLLSYVVPVKSKVKILKNFVAFSEYMNFTRVLYVPLLPVSLKIKRFIMQYLGMRHIFYALSQSWGPLIKYVSNFFFVFDAH